MFPDFIRNIGWTLTSVLTGVGILLGHILKVVEPSNLDMKIIASLAVGSAVVFVLDRFLKSQLGPYRWIAWVGAVAGLTIGFFAF